MSIKDIEERLDALEDDFHMLRRDMKRVEGLSLSADRKAHYISGQLNRREKTMKIKYLIFDVVKLALPLIATQFLPDGAPSNEIVASLLYILATVLGVDSVAKTINAIRSDSE